MVIKKQAKVQIIKSIKQKENFTKLCKKHNKRKLADNIKKTAVVLLTNKKPTDHELSILKKGVNFSLVPKKTTKKT